MGRKRKIQSRTEFEEALEETISPYVVDKFKHVGGLLYKLDVGGSTFFLITGLSAVPAPTLEEYFLRYIAVLETLFSLEPGEWRGITRAGKIVRYLAHHLVAQTGLITVAKFVEKISKDADRAIFYRKLRLAHKELKNPEFKDTLEAAVEITRKYFYEHFRLYDDYRNLGASRIRFSRGKAIPDGVFIGIDRRDPPTFPLSDRSSRNSSNNRRAIRRNTKLPGLSF